MPSCRLPAAALSVTVPPKAWRSSQKNKGCTYPMTSLAARRPEDEACGGGLGRGSRAAQGARPGLVTEGAAQRRGPQAPAARPTRRTEARALNSGMTCTSVEFHRADSTACRRNSTRWQGARAHSDPSSRAVCGLRPGAARRHGADPELLARTRSPTPSASLGTTTRSSASSQARQRQADSRAQEFSTLTASSRVSFFCSSEATVVGENSALPRRLLGGTSRAPGSSLPIPAAPCYLGAMRTRTRKPGRERAQRNGWNGALPEPDRAMAPCPSKLRRYFSQLSGTGSSRRWLGARAPPPDGPVPSPVSGPPGRPSNSSAVAPPPAFKQTRTVPTRSALSVCLEPPTRLPRTAQQPHPATMREVISIHIGQAGIQVSVAATAAQRAGRPGEPARPPGGRGTCHMSRALRPLPAPRAPPGAPRLSFAFFCGDVARRRGARAAGSAARGPGAAGTRPPRPAARAPSAGPFAPPARVLSPLLGPEGQGAPPLAAPGSRHLGFEIDAWIPGPGAGPRLPVAPRGSLAPFCAAASHRRAPEPPALDMARRSVTPAGSCTASSTASSPMARCPRTRPSAAATTPSTPSSRRRAPASTSPAACSSTSSPP